MGTSLKYFFIYACGTYDHYYYINNNNTQNSTMQNL